MIEDQSEADAFYEREMPGPETRALFDEARALGIGFHLGYAEIVEEGGVLHRFNTSILVDKQGTVVGKYRKIHLPGTTDPIPGDPGMHLEKRYFEVGNLGFGVWRNDGCGDGHVHLQRPALARNLSGHGAAGRGADHARLQLTGWHW